MPVLSCLLNSLPFLLPFILFQFGLLIVPGGVQRDKVAAHCSFPPVLFLTIVLVQGCCCEEGDWGGGWLSWVSTAGFSLSCGHSQYVRNTGHFHAPSSPTVSLTPGHRCAVFVRKWLAIWSERPHICPANEKAGLHPIYLPEHCPYTHRSRTQWG